MIDGKWIVVVSVMLTGCASMTAQECQTVDWYQKGLEDGRDGRREARLATYRGDCAEHGLRPDEPLYIDGRLDGLRTYCRLENAVSSGLAGRRYEGVCPAEVDASFRRCNAMALDVHATKARVQELDDKIEAAIRALRRSEKDDTRREKERKLELEALERHRERMRIDLHVARRQLDSVEACR